MCTVGDKYLRQETTNKNKIQETNKMKKIIQRRGKSDSAGDRLIRQDTNKYDR